MPAVKERWCSAMKEWEKERDAARAERRKAAGKKPTLQDFGGLEKGIPRPKLEEALNDETSSGSDSDDSEAD
jgi:hypothetical protein